MKGGISVAEYRTERKINGFFYRFETAERVSVDAHAHGTYEIFRISAGSSGGVGSSGGLGHFSCTIEGQEYTLSTGDIIFMLPGERHMSVSNADGACSRQIIRLEREYLTDKFPDVVSELDGRPRGKCSYIPASLASKYALDIIFSQIHEYAASDKDEAETMLHLCSLVLVTKISEILKYEYSDDKLQMKKNIKKITDYINDNITDAINLDGIASYLYLDKSYVCRLFKRETGLTINEYINMTRIALAKQMILSGTLPRDAYTRCGYNDYSTFYRAFRRHAGVSPEEFKRGYANNQNYRRET